MILSCTGHRPNKLNREFDMDGPMSFEIMTEVASSFDELKPDKILNGMALGFDQIVTRVAILRNIPVVACVPYAGQEAKWSVAAQQRYRKLLDHPLVSVEIISDGGFANWKLHYRNKHMINNSNALLACWNGEQDGGTYGTVQYANEKGLQVYNIWKPEWNEQYAG